MHLQKLNEEPLKAGAVTAATFQDTSGQLCGFQTFWALMERNTDHLIPGTRWVRDALPSPRKATR